MVSIRSSYHPIDAAILWCDLADHQGEILQVDLSHPGSLLKHFPQWPFLHAYTERIYDAIVGCELPATYLGRPITSNDQAERVYWSIRHSDLRVWFARNYPEEKPAFLFSQCIDHSECVSLTAHLALQAERDAGAREIEKLRQAHSAIVDEAALAFNHQGLSAQLGTLEVPSEASAGVQYTIIGALLEVVLGKSKSGQLRSIYKNQAAVVDAITTQFPGVPGLSKRTLDRKFAEARRHLAQALQA
ncbi:hypothetical protein [Pseudomonas baetica]|uniref:hypothetical protein n=1 Tax=Pseudomonas baetica TaxID=674054 RepID=UPI0024058E75|nr:hypothetical protein [Pseudomonas baetica]MDF9773227.1 hypothetical protein [Pseudomonas baetica]